MGVFIFRDAIGHGHNDWKGIKLRWMHGADKVDPAKAAIKVHPIAMVYVPEGPFKLGSTAESGISPFADGPDVPLMRYDGEEAYENIPQGLRRVIESTTGKDGGPYIRWGHDPSPNGATDGAWRGGPTIPFLVDAEWNAPAAEGTRGRLVGPFAGRLWSTHTFVERSAGGTPVGPLNDDYPTGYDAFYCMKYEMTQGQYVDFLNSLPPDVAAQRAIVSHETRSDAGMYGEEVKVDLGPNRTSYTVTERGGNTIRSSADVPASASAELTVDGDLSDDKKNDSIDSLLDEMFEDKTTKGAEKPQRPPVYMARCPFRKMPGVAGADMRAFAVWAGLRPMTSMELTKVIAGPHDPAVPDPSAVWANTEGGLEVADSGLPTERIVKGKSGWGSDRATRVGSCATATSDRSTARATYWGILEFDGMWAGVVPLPYREFRGTHGNGGMPAGTPGASFRRGFAEFKEKPADWPIWGEYLGRFAPQTCRLVASASNRLRSETAPGQDRVRKPVDKQAAPRPAEPARGAQFKPADARRVDIPRVANVKWEAATKDYSTVSFDLAWNNSWRAKWEEPADKNVTGKPLKVESWDAAWVFVKFRPAGARDDSHAMLSSATKDHQVPAGAELEVGLDNDGSRGVGVFIHRSAAGVGANDFKGIKLRWLSGDNSVDPAKIDVKVHAIAMVYIPEGPFASRSPWGHALTTITTPDATQPGGHLESGTNSVPLHAGWPNGYNAFYGMKYSISQGEYAGLLNSMSSGTFNGARYSVLAHNNARRYHPAFYNFNGYTITTDAAGMYKADVPDRMCNILSLPDIEAFIAWAGLRPLTNLEYEKACRGPRAVAGGADAWTPAACAPAAGLDKAVLAAPSAVGPGPSYWGIRELSFSGCVQEWPSVIQNEWTAGADFKGVHGNGSPEAPGNWPWSFFGDGYYGGIWRGPGYGTVGQWINATELMNMPWELMDASRTGRYGAHAARTAAIEEDPDALLQIDALPRMEGVDLGIFYLAGSFRNDGDKALKVEIATPLPDACLPDGAAARAFTAAPKAVTPFKILAALTRDTAAGAVGRGTLLPIRIQTPAGEVLAEALARMPLLVPPNFATPVIQSLAGGELTLRITNTTDRAHPLRIELRPADLKVAEPIRDVPLAAGAGARVSFPIRRQAFANEGPRRMAYRVTVADSAPQDGTTAVDMRVQSRWWIHRRVQAGPQMAGVAGGPGGMDALGDIAGMLDADSFDTRIFDADNPPPDWARATYGAGISYGAAESLPSRGSAMLAATRVQAPAEREAVVALSHKQDLAKALFDFKVWFNNGVVFSMNADGKGESKPFRIRKTGNTMAVECRSASDGSVTPGTISLSFSDARDGKPVGGLVLDMEARLTP